MLSPRNPAPKPQQVLASGADPSGSLTRQELEKALAAWPLSQKRPLWPKIQVKHPSSAAHPRSQTTTPGETSLTLSPPVTSFPGSQPSSCPKLTPASPRHGRAQDLSTNRGPQLRFLRHSPTLPCGALHAHRGHRCTNPSSDPAAPHPSLPPPWASPQASCTLATYPLWQERPRLEASRAQGTELQGPRSGKVAWKEIPAPRPCSLGLTDPWAWERGSA